VTPADEVDEEDDRPRRRRSGGRSRGACPQCGSKYIQKGPWPWYLGTVGAFLCKAMVCEDCGHEFDLFKPQADLAKRKLHLALAINGVGLVGIIGVLTALILFVRMSMNG
jgi:DNA-directed RNA polymerase subunit RPC12/RpoP